MVLPDPDAAILDAHEAIEKLETRIEALEERSYPEFDAEHERRADWKRTYDAVLPHVLVLHVQGCSDGSEEDEDPEARAHEDATRIADHAHGPLKAKRESLDELLRPLLEHDPHDIKAVVKAARELGQMLTDFMSQEMYGEHLMEGMEREDFDALNEARTRVLTKCEAFETPDGGKP